MHALFAENIEKSFGDRIILRGASLRIVAGEKVGLVGVNGAGKSTLLRILTSQIEHDHGRLDLNGRIAHLDQNPTLEGPRVLDAISSQTRWHQQLLEGYEQALIEGDEDSASLLQDRLDAVGWDLSHSIDAVLTQLSAPDKETPIKGLSGGEVRRVALAQTLLSGAEILILDEPTNHLDTATIEWLEAYLSGHRGAVLLVTHDRYLLEKVATRILEIEDGLIVSYDGSYGDYLVSRAERQMRLARDQERRMKLIAKEAAWAARSPAARSTKQKARLQRLDALLEQRNLPREQQIQIGLNTRDKFGGSLMDVVDLSFGYDEVLFQKLSFSVTPKSRFGIIGPNGSGKSTLLKCLVGDLQPNSGQIRKAGRVVFGLLDQHRTGLNPEKTVFEEAGGGNDHVKIGEHFVHVATFLKRLLFDREQLDQLVGGLSGGERARLLLSKLILSGANLLILDEPTNDLDLQTLRSLEDALLEFQGAVIMVTHDRAFLDRVSTSVLSFEGNGSVVEYASRAQALRRLQELRATGLQEKQKKNASQKNTEFQKEEKTKKLSYKERQELEALPELIEQEEQKREELLELLSDPGFYQQGGSKIGQIQEQANLSEDRIGVLYERWEELAQRE
ncbi:MAG: hypothetical protein CMK59_08705 [Proteobacteria bacterium]|nr:hypothetical protein [Pseudomonadota bacterium]